MSEKIICCSNCGNEIEKFYYKCLDNYIQTKYFDTDEENVFCSYDCFCKYVQLEEIDVKDSD